MPRPNFLDLHPAWNCASGYYATNESPKGHYDLLGDARYRQALSICSGGEVPLFVLGPRSENIIAVDHSYMSLTATYLKAIALDNLGLRGFKSLMLERPVSERKSAFKSALAEVPEALNAVVTKPVNGYITFVWNSFVAGDASRWIREIPDELEAAIPEVLGKLTLVHGDLFDVAVPEGGFDIAYVSNAHEHSGRGGWDEKHMPAGMPPKPSLKSLTRLVGIGKHLLITGGLTNSSTYGGSDNSLSSNKEWREVQQTHAGTWQHHLLERQLVAEVAA